MSKPDDGPGTIGTTPIEQRLRAALVARTDQIEQRDLRPAAVPGARTHPERSRAPRRILGAVAAAAVMVTAATGVQLLNRSQDASPPASVAANSQPTVTFSTRTETIDGAVLTYPVAQAHGGAADVAARIDTALNGRIDDLIGSFRSRSGDLDPAPEQLMLEITPATTGSWRQFLSVRFDVLENFGGAHPANSSSAVVINSRDGSLVGAEQVFSDVAGADQLMRTSIAQAAGPSVNTDEVGALSMQPGPDGGTGALAWYPAADGLHWVVDRGAIAAEAVGQPTAVVPWTQLGALLRAPA
jgi:hypothetical protein